MPRHVPDHVPELATRARELTAYDFDPNDCVELTFEDDSYVVFNGAFALREGPDDEFIVVYTEHCGYITFFANTVNQPWRPATRPADFVYSEDGTTSDDDGGT